MRKSFYSLSGIVTGEMKRYAGDGEAFFSSATTILPRTLPIIHTFMGCCKLAQVDVRKWQNYFFTHIHDYDNDNSRDLLELRRAPSDIL